MAATCISSILGKLKSVVCRNADNKEPDKMACMQEISRLLNDKQKAASGWSILKFSGDTSHIVFGEIMGWIKNKYDMRFQINYLLAERPLAGRLLSIGKTIMMVSTNVFMKNFTGKGSENKDHRRAAFYITFDKSISYINIIEGLYEKINNVYTNGSQYTLALKSPFIQSLQSLPTDTTIFPEKAAYLSNVTGETLQSNPTIDNIGDQEMSVLNKIMNDPNIVIFLQAYEVDELTKKLNDIPTDFKTLGIQLIGRRLLGVRIGSKSNWILLIDELYNRERNLQHNSEIVKQYDNIRQIMSLSSLLSDKSIQETEIREFLNTVFANLKNDQGFEAIFNKMIKAYSDQTKLNKFEDQLIADWLNNKKGESQKIPGSVELIIQELKLFIVDCLKVNNILDDAKVPIKGGGNIINNKQYGGITSQDVHNDAQEFIDEFEDTVTQSMMAYNPDGSTSIDYSEIETMVKDFVGWRIDAYNKDLNIIDESSKYIGSNANIYKVISNRVLLLSGLLDVSDASFFTHINNNFEFVINSYVVLGFPEMKIDKKLFHEIILKIETSLNTTKTFNLIDNLSKYNNIQADMTAFQRDVQTEYPLIFDNFQVVFNSLYTELSELVNNITTIVLTDDNNENISNIILYLQKYNRIMAKYQLLQPYQAGASRITILERIVQKAFNTFGNIDGGKKTKKRRKNYRKKKGSKKIKKTKKRRTIKKNRKK